MTSLLTFTVLYCVKEIDSMLPCVCSAIDHGRRQNVVRTSVIHPAIASSAKSSSNHILPSSVMHY